MAEEKKLVDPFVILNTDESAENKDPDKKMYLLLLSGYDEEGEYFEMWDFIEGRTAARQYCIDNIHRIDPKESYVLVEQDKICLSKVLIPTVYQLFTDPRSSWANQELFPDGFNIDEEIESYDNITNEVIENRNRDQNMSEVNNELTSDVNGIDV